MKYFKDNISKYQEEDARLSKLFNQISTIRIITFVAALILAIYVADIPDAKALGIVIVLFLISFVILVKWHNRVKYRRNHVRHLKQINEEEMLRIDGDLSSFDGGEEFKSRDHFYENDLDIFGRNSLFQLLNRCTTVTGRKMLAEWLQYPATKLVILKRQQAISELKESPEFCQNFQAIGLHHQDDKATFEPLQDWLSEKSEILSKKWLLIASYILPVISTALLIGVSWFDIPFGYLLIALLVNGLLLKSVFKYAVKITEQTSKGVSTLEAIGLLISEVEKTQYPSSLLEEIKNDFSEREILASTRIRSLAKILDFLNSRMNMLYGLINFLFLLDIHFISRAEKWKSENATNVKNWFDRISEFEALASMARFAFANPNYVMADIVEQNYHFKTTKISHPLIKSYERVGNDFEAINKGNVMIITGSNMSGKSTFLRTIGVNVVLAMAGAPVCAESMELSKILVFTSMRTQDNLEEHISSFYAELKRIEQLLELVKRDEIPVLFMLDEILKGTNSHDRHKGAVAIVNQLHKTNSFGFVSTHDIELGQQAELLDYCSNYNFSSSIVADKILFDYKISQGVCKSFNASTLMKNIGIEVE